MLFQEKDFLIAQIKPQLSLTPLKKEGRLKQPSFL